LGAATVVQMPQPRLTTLRCVQSRMRDVMARLPGPRVRLSGPSLTEPDTQEHLFRAIAQAFRASTCASSRPRCGSVGTSSVGAVLRSAHS
jgi:hypothetical protein